VARYTVGGGKLCLLIETHQEPWSPEFAGHLRVSSLQTGMFAGPVGSAIGQHPSEMPLSSVKHNAMSRCTRRSMACSSSGPARLQTLRAWWPFG
jgi:hypothetical protein